MKRVIVTGANGFIGSRLIRRLVSEKINVYALGRSFENIVDVDNAYLNEIRTDLDDTDNLLKKLDYNSYDVMYHLAWHGMKGKEKTDPQVQLRNEEVTLRCADIAYKLRVGKFITTGTISENNVKSLPELSLVSGSMMYGVAKYSAHLMLDTFCKQKGLDYIWMQLANVYGSGDKTGNLISYTIDCLNRDVPAKFGPADQPYDFIHVDDVIEALIRIGYIRKPKSFYYVGSGNPRLLRDYLTEIGKIYDKWSLIQIGKRPDDGIRYSFDLFDTSDLKKDIGDYVNGSFTHHLRKYYDKRNQYK